MAYRPLHAALAFLGLAAASGFAHAAPQYYGGGGSDRVVRCESNDNRYRECATGSRGRVELLRQLSSTRCMAARGESGIWPLCR